MSGYDPKKVYIGGCTSATEEALSATFQHYGTIDRLWVAKSPPGFAFVWFGDERDAADAVAGLDGTEIGPDRVTVAIAKGKGDRAPRDGPGSGRAPPPRDMRAPPRDDGPRRGDEPGAPRPRRPKGPGGFRVKLSGLPEGCDWRELKDTFRRSGEVSYADARGTEGVVEFSSEEDRRRCIDDFDNTTLRGSRLACVATGGSTSEFFERTSAAHGRQADRAYRDDYDDRAPPPRAAYDDPYGAPPRRPEPPRDDRYYEPRGGAARPPPPRYYDDDDRYDRRRGYDDRYDDRYADRGPPPPRPYRDDPRGPPPPRRAYDAYDDRRAYAPPPRDRSRSRDRYDPEPAYAEPPPRDYDAPPAPYDDRAYRR